MVTIKDVSRLAKVSKSTVSRVIADNGYVSETKRRAVEEAIATLGYRPNTMARGLRSNRSNIIGGVVLDVTSPFYAQMVGGTQQACRDAGKGLLLSSGFGDTAEEERAIIELVDRSCDGLVLNLENPIRREVSDIIRAAGIPVVMVGASDYPVADGAVTVDNAGGAEAGMTYLLDQGHRRIAHLGGGTAHRDSRQRVRGIERALEAKGLTLDDIHIEHGTFTEQYGYDAIKRLFAHKAPYSAIFAGDDDIAAGAVLALKELGYRIPEDVSVIGFDDNFHARHLTPALTTVRQPIGEVGRIAAEMLLKLLSGHPLEQKTVIVPAELVVRGSVAAPSGSAKS